jgi:uncharacterized protein YkwD
VSAPSKLLSAVFIAIALLLCLTAAPALAGSRAHARHHQRPYRRNLQRDSRSACQTRRHGECGSGAGGARSEDAKRPRRVPRPRPREQAPSVSGSTPAGASAAATIAALLATPCQNTELVPSTGDLPLVRAAVLCLINHERAEHSESPLLVNPQLEAAAESHCQELIADDYFAHVSPSGETPVERIEKAGYVPGPSVGYVIGENLAWGTYALATPQSIVTAWIASPGHLANILETQYRETGIAIVPAVPQSLGEGSPGGTYAQEFGVIIH